MGNNSNKNEGSSIELGLIIVSVLLLALFIVLMISNPEGTLKIGRAHV